MFLVKVYTFPKIGVLDPQGDAIKMTVSSSGFEHVKDA